MKEFYDQRDIERINEKISVAKFNYAVHTSCYGSTLASVGDIWMVHRDAREELLKRDRKAEFAFFVCSPSSGNYYPHGHGLVQTSLSPGDLRKCFCFRQYSIRVDTLRTDQDCHTMRSYILDSSRNAIIRNSSILRIRCSSKVRTRRVASEQFFFYRDEVISQ